MTDQAILGPRLRRYRTSVSLLAVAWYLSIGPLLVIAGAAFVVLFDREPVLLLWCAAAGLLVLVISIIFLAWCSWAHLDLHREGVALGRSVLGGRPRAMWFTEIHPVSIRVFSDIDTICPLRGGQLREGLERGGCPPHLARWSAQFGIEELKGTGLRAQGRIPGMWVDWTS